jgi:hypothetical protein
VRSRGQTTVFTSNQNVRAVGAQAPSAVIRSIRLPYLTNYISQSALQSTPCDTQPVHLVADTSLGLSTAVLCAVPFSRRSECEVLRRKASGRLVCSQVECSRPKIPPSWKTSSLYRKAGGSLRNRRRLLLP